MQITGLASFIAGARLDPTPDAPRIRSLDGAHELPVAETSPVELRRALRYADGCQTRLLATTLEQRIEAARLVMSEYERRSDDVARMLAQFRGLVCCDARWMCQVSMRWAEQLGVLADIVFGGALTREVRGAGGRIGELHWRSKGTAALFSSSSMDGPAAVVALCHAMLSGTHVIFRPSFRDTATHLAFDILHEHGLDDYAQLVRWRSEHSAAPLLNRQLLGNVAQAMIFSSNETFRELLDSAATPGSAEWDAVYSRAKRYGTGLPLAVVTARADLDRAARDLVEGARLGGGRFCLSAGPVLVEASCHDELVERAATYARVLRRGSAGDERSQLSSHEPESAEGLRAAVGSLGGTVAFGEIRSDDMDVVGLADVPTSSSALHRELPGPVLSFIPVQSLAQAGAVASTALRRNQREAWTATVFFGDDEEYRALQQSVESFRYLRGGVVAQVKLLLPHQGSYFALDFLRRVSLE